MHCLHTIISIIITPGLRILNFDEIMDVARAIDAKGLSVTIPFKQDVIALVDEIDEHAARSIGAVNTVVFACGTAIGYNTDWLGVRKPLVSMKGAKAVLLGAGGVAAGAAYALKDLDMDVTILNRTPENAKKLAEQFGCAWGSWDEFDRIKPDLVVNATPLGMQPDTRSPLREDQLQENMTVFDLVYTPPVTPLIEAARAKGCRTISGTEMFIEQAREQFYLFFGIDVPPEKIREFVAMNSLGRNFRITTFGESHGAAVGVVIDGCPAGMDLTEQDIQPFLDRRRPGTSPLVSPRQEKDRVEILSGIFEGKTTGAPIALLVRNENQQPGDYEELREKFRPGHADFTYQEKYRSSGITGAGAGVPGARPSAGLPPVPLP